MNAKNAHEFMPLVQALANGLTIQEDFFGEWSDLSDEISFNMKPEFYRIKPKPRTFEMWLDKDTGCLSTDELIREFGHVRFNSLERITVQEVVK